MSRSRSKSWTIGIVGGGVAGLFSAWMLARAGQKVTLLETGKCGKGATGAAAGMLAPVNELEFNELELLHAGIASRNLYMELESELGDIGLIREGTLEVGIHPDDLLWLKRLYEYQVKQGMKVEWLTGKAIREMEPFLSNQVQFAIWSPEDIQVENKWLVKRLMEGCQALGVEIREDAEVSAISGNQEEGVTLTSDNKTYKFDKGLVTIGTGKITGASLPYKIYPVKGEMVSLQPPEGEFLRKTVRIRNKVLGNAYIVPKAERILLGSTSEEKGFSERNTAGGLMDILRKAYSAVPGIYELEVNAVWAGLRPSTLNRLPLIGKEQGKEIYHINGLYRHGILMAPLAAQAICELMLGGTLPEPARPFLLR